MTFGVKNQPKILEKVERRPLNKTKNKKQNS